MLWFYSGRGDGEVCYECPRRMEQLRPTCKSMMNNVPSRRRTQTEGQVAGNLSLSELNLNDEKRPGE